MLDRDSKRVASDAMKHPVYTITLLIRLPVLGGFVCPGAPSAGTDPIGREAP